MKTAMLLITLVVISLGVSAPLYSTDHMYSTNPSLFVPDTQCVVVGEMARLSVEGDRVAWDCVPAIEDGQAFSENNQKFVCSFRTPGLYTVVAAVYINDDVMVQKFPIQVGPPVSPDPAVPVTPEPKPTITVNTEVVSTTVQWCEDTACDKPQCLLLADVFDKVATEIESGNLTSVDAIIMRTAELNSALELGGILKLMEKIQEYIRAESDASRLVDTLDYTLVWKSFAAGLREYAR